MNELVHDKGKLHPLNKLLRVMKAVEEYGWLKRRKNGAM